MYPQAKIFEDPRFQSAVWMSWELEFYNHFTKEVLLEEQSVPRYEEVHGRAVGVYDCNGIAKNIAHRNTAMGKPLPVCLAAVTMQGVPPSSASSSAMEQVSSSSAAVASPMQPVWSPAPVPACRRELDMSQDSTRVVFVNTDGTVRDDTATWMDASGRMRYRAQNLPPSDLMPCMNEIESRTATEGIFKATVVFMHGNSKLVGWFHRMEDYGKTGPMLHRGWQDEKADRRWSELKCRYFVRVTWVSDQYACTCVRRRK
jgi:hypothetical protein